MAYNPIQLGQATKANSQPVVLASDSDALPVSSTTLATSAKQDTIIGHVDGIEGLLATIDADTGSIDTKTPALGQALAASSVPVVLTAAQVTTLTPPAAITGFATSDLQLANNHNVVVTSVTAGTSATNLGKAVDSAAGATDTGVASLRIRDDVLTTITPADGDYAPARVDSFGSQWVNLSTKLDSVNDSITAVGGVAHDGADSGNPIKTGGRATNVEIAAVANNDRTDAVFTLTGKQIVQLFCPPENIVRGVTAAMTATTSTSVIAAPASGLRNYITSVTVGNSHATVGTFVNLQDGSGGTTIWTIPAASVFGGATISFSPPLRQPTTATALFCACVTTGSNTIVSANGYIGV